jgi:parallel beta-helix repeat protein
VMIRGCTNTVSGNVVSGNGQLGISLAGNNGYAAGNVVFGNFIGVDATGSSALGNGNAGVGISGAANNSIGNGNVISGNGYAGLFLFGVGATGNTIFGNKIGTDANGAIAVPNSAGGIYAESVVSNTIGGMATGAGNVISGNLNSSGILLTNASGFSILGNDIGLNAAGSAALKNWGGGITISHASLANWIGGSAVGARNVISGNNTYGVFVTGSTAQVIQGNYIGTDASGNFAIGNSADGINLQNSTNNFLGGTGAGNVVSGNGGTGFPEIELNLSIGNTVQGNDVGLNAAGMAGIGPTTADGIYLLNSSSNLVGGIASGASNVVSSNNVGIYFNNASWNVARGNFVGLAADGSSPLGNANHNVLFQSGSTNNILGGINAGEANRIAFAQTIFAGVRVRTNAFNNLISGNFIYSNGALGIDLGNAGTNPIIHLQAGVAGTNANRLQNYPVLTNAVSGTATLIRGSFDSVPNKTYALEFFASPVGNASGNGEGQLFLGQTNLVLGNVSPTNFSFVLPTTVPAGWVVTATATDGAKNTSEFSNWVMTSPVPQLQAARGFVAGQFTLSWTNSGGSYTLLQSSNLNPPQWTATGINSPTNGVYSIPVTVTNPEYFYRLQAQ